MKGTTMANRCGITTKDNPFSPFTEWTDWYRYDMQMGYGTCDYLGRIAKTSFELSDEENEEEIERAIDEILKYDFMNQYKKVFSDSFDNDNESNKVSDLEKEEIVT